MWTRGLVVLLATGCVLVAAGPASAHEARMRDGRGDVWRISSAGATQPATGSTLGDVTRAVVGYTKHRARVRIVFAALARRGRYAQYTVRFQGHRHHRVRVVVVEAGRHGWAGTHRVFKGNGSLAHGCTADARHRIDYGRNRVSVRLGSGCLGLPGSVRVNVNAYRANQHGAFFGDNPHNDRADASGWSSWVRR